MTCYSIELRDPIFVKFYGFLYMSKNNGKNVSKNLFLGDAKQSATNALKTTSKNVI